MTFIDNPAHMHRQGAILHLDRAQALADELLARHALHDWRFRFDHARQRCGSCNHAVREITLSRHFTALNDPSEVRNTLLHEIAHALAGPEGSHGPHWRSVARRIGARPDATNHRASMPEPRWGLKCQSCGAIVGRRHRRTLDLHRTRCAACGVRDGRLVWEDLGALEA